ncbi:CCA tRNA nucleotidyltransferase [Paenibacillus lentus]|uniref:CCA tRNA nucleotidyltransferase n=1 Tax=Paenibacillus lentus TaxID=1338368 RepID=UPI00365A0EE6
MRVWKQVDPLMQHQGEKVLKALLESGYSAYFVGGCVRDELMNRPVHDMDIATSAKPETVMELFERTIPTGLQHGTVTVLMGDYPFEVTTFRKESHYEDHRHPAAVEFVDGIIEDLQRRDFTMNAIARSLDGELTDPFLGLPDIRRGIIRCVGEAEERFDEDALRMMRAIRFASVFGFRPVKSLWRALLKGRDKLSYVAMERIRAELERLLLGSNPLRGLELLRRSQLLHYAKNPFKELREQTQEQEERLQALGDMPAEPQELRWSMLLQGLGVSGLAAEARMKEWTFSNHVAQTTAEIMMFDETWHEMRAGIGREDQERLRRGFIELQLLYGQTISGLWLERQSRWLDSKGSEGQEARLRLNEEERRWHRTVPVHDLKELAIRGGDVLTALGQRGGPWLGELMKRILLLVAVGDAPNEKEYLLEYVKAVVKQNGS